MAASRSSPSPPPTQALSTGGGAHIPLFLDSDLGTHLVLSVAADSTIRGIKAQVAAEHAAAFPDIGPVVVKSFQVPRKGAMYHLADSMAVMSPFSKVEVEGQYFLHVNMAAAETNAMHQCGDEDRGTSSGVLPPMQKGREDDGAWVAVHAHDVHLSSSSQRNTERKSTTLCPATDVRTISVPSIDKSTSYKQGEKHGDQIEGGYVNSTSVTLVGKEVGTKEEDLLHSVEDCELGFVSPDKQMVRREEKLGQLHAMDDLSEEKDCKKARVTGSFDTSAVDPIRETNDYKTRDVENLDKFPVETSTNSHGVHSSTSCQQGVDGNVKEDSNKLENPITTRKNKDRKKIQSVTSKDVCAQEMTEPSTEAVEVPKATGEDLLHENQGLQGHGASNVEMASRDKTNVIPTDMLLPSSQQNSGSQVTKHVQLGTDAQATSDLAADQSNIDLVIVGDVSISTCKVVAGEEKSLEGTIDLYHDESAVDASNMGEGSKREDVLETIDNSSQEKNWKQSKKVSSVGLTSMDAAEAKDQCGYGKKAGESDIISTQREIVSNPYKRQITSNAQQGDFYVIENPNGDVKQQQKKKKQKKRRREPESSKDDPTQGAAKSSGLIGNAVSTQNTGSHCLHANQITLGNIGEETADAKDQCRREKAAELVIVSTQVSVHDPSNVKQGDSDVLKNPNGDGKRKKKKIRHLESSKDDPLRRSEKISDLTDVLTENTAVPADGRTKSTKRQRSKVSLKNAPTNSDKSIQSLGEQVRHVPAEDLKGENFNKAELFQGCTAVDAPASTVQILQKKSKRSSKTRTPKLEEVNHSITDTGGNHKKESTVGAPDKTSALTGRKKHSKTELQSQCTNLEHGSDHFGTGNVGMPSVSAQHMNRGDGNVKKGKKKSKQKSDMVKPESLKTNGGNQDTDNCPQDLMQSDVQNGRVEQGNAKENNDKAIQNDSLMQQETQDATRDSTLEMKPHQSMSGADSQTNLPIVKDYARMSKKQRNSTSQTKCHAKSRNHDGSIDERTSTNPNAVSNLVQSISMNPQASDESACGTPAVDQFRVAVRNVPRKKYKKAKDKSKKDMRKRETGMILGDTISKSSEEVLSTMGEKAAIGNSSSTFADSAQKHLPGSLATTVESVGDGQRAALLTSPPINEVSRVSTPNWESQPEVMRERERRSKSNAERPSRKLALEEEVMVQRAFTDEKHASPTPGSGI